MATGTIKTIGTLYTGTNAASQSVPSGTTTTLSTLEIPSGTYIITGGMEWASGGFNGIYDAALYNGNNVMGGSRVRNSAEGGGGSSMTMCVTFSSNVTINLKVTQSSGSAKTASNARLRAIRII